MAKEIVLGGNPIVVGEIVVEKTSKGEDLKVINCDVDSGMYKSEAEAAGLDFKVVTRVNNFNGKYIHETYSAAVKAGVAILEENKDADRVEFTAPYINDHLTSRTSKLEMSVDRCKDVLIPGKGIEQRPVMSIKVINKMDKLPSSYADDLKLLMQEKLAIK